jgi:hypothetical protein
MEQTIREQLEVALNASVDGCPRCKICDAQIGAAMTVLAPLLERAEKAEAELAQPLSGADFTEGASDEPVFCGCGEPITEYDGEWLHIINPVLRGTDDHDAHPGDE